MHKRNLHACHLLECDFFKNDRDILLNSYPQAFNPNSALNPHLLADFSDFHLCKIVADCMKQIDNSYFFKVDLSEGLPSLGASRLGILNISRDILNIVRDLLGKNLSLSTPTLNLSTLILL